MSIFRSNVIYSVAVLFLFCCQLALAEIYKCEEGGKLVMQDMPCPDGVAQSTIDVVIQNGQKKVDPFAYDESQFSDWENKLIKAGKVEVGMSIEALQQSWGRPIDINRSAYSPEQWVFRGHRYAYVHDGKVVNWQD